MDNSNKTDKYFSDRLGNFEAGPPESTWDSIVRKLDNKKKKRVVMLVFRIAAGMAILVSTGLGFYFLRSTGDGPKTSVIAVNKVGKERIASDTLGLKNSFINESGREVRKDVPETNVPEVPRNNEIIGRANQEPSLKYNTFRNDNISPVEIRSSVNDEQDISYLAQIDPVRAYVTSDSLGRDINFNDLHPDTSLSAEEASRLLLAQYYGEEVPVEERRQNWSLGSEIAPLYSYRSVSSENSDLMSASSIDDFNDTENGILAYAGGIRIGFSTSRRLSVQSGIYYSRYGQEKNGVQPVATSSGESNNQFMAVSNSTGTITGVIDEKNNKNYYYSELDVISNLDIRSGVTNSTFQPVASGDEENISLKQYFDYFEVPLIMKYKIIDRKIDFSFSGGLITNFLVGNSVNMINNGKSTRISKTDDINVVNYQGSLGMGLEYPIKSNFALTIEPRFRYYLNSIDKSSTAISVHPFSFGFFAGINYRF